MNTSKQIENIMRFSVFNNKTFLAIIPARSGSKGLPGKNVKEICGKPLISWSIKAGLTSKYIDEVVVSTDCPQTKVLAEECGALVPFLRPDNLSSDTATSFDVIKHSIDFYNEKLGRTFDYIVLLEPTSPLRQASDIDDSIELLMESDAESIVGICKTECQNPVFLVHKNEENIVSGYLNQDIKVLRRQDIEDVFFLEGTIYISEVNNYMKNKTFYHQGTIGYEVDKYKSLEIDDIDDFIMVEALMKHKGY
jgi:CMP-N,N'-diacetyllegionaminic acid synthase